MGVASDPTESRASPLFSFRPTGPHGLLAQMIFCSGHFGFLPRLLLGASFLGASFLGVSVLGACAQENSGEENKHAARAIDTPSTKKEQGGAKAPERSPLRK